MDGTLTLIDLAGSIALLLWGVHMVQSGVQRAFGPNLRRVLGAALGNRFKAFLAGLGITAVLQSSTATGLMVTGSAAGGLVDLAPGLAAMARRQCRHDIDRAGLVVRHLAGGAALHSDRRDDVPPRRHSRTRDRASGSASGCS